VGILPLLFILLSLLGTFVTLSKTDVIAARDKIGAQSAAKLSLASADSSTPTKTPTLTPTMTPSSTLTPSPTATPTMLPTPTSTSKPSPTATAKPSPAATAKPSPKPTVAPTALPTSSISSTPSISPTHASQNAVTLVTPGATSIGPAASPPSLVRSQTTPTTTPILHIPREQQNKTFPFMALAIGVPGITATFVFLFIGWWLLRKRLLPQSTVKLPPSGASPWSRVRQNDTLMTNVNGTLPLDANNAQLSLSTSQMLLRSNGIDPFDDISETNIPPIVSDNSISADNEDIYEQWLHNNNVRNPDLNDPYLKELIKQFSDKTRTTQQQNVSNFRNEQTDLASNDA
jgi:hypothetical protein